jgi:uncharacterized membrane-anchored protein
MAPLVKRVLVNGLQYNANRDPQAYRRTPGVAFRIQATVDGRGPTRVALVDAAGKAIAAGEIQAPATWTHEVTYADVGSRLVRLEASRGAERWALDLRLDVVDAAHA